MKIYFLHLLFLSLSSLCFSQRGEIPPMAEPGKCYAKCLILPKIIEVTKDYFIYTGTTPEEFELEEIEIIIEEAQSIWQMDEEKGIQSLVRTPAIVRNEMLIKDTTQTDDYIVESITVWRKEKTTQRREWREVLCNEKISQTKTKQLQEILLEKGFYQGAINGNMDLSTKSALTNYQRKNKLPIGNLDRETFESLDIYW